MARRCDSGVVNSRADVRSRHKPRVVIAGGAGWGNVGDDLIADRIARRSLASGKSVTVLGGPERPSVPDSVRHIVLDGAIRTRLAVAWEIARAEKVIIGGGGLFDDRMAEFFRPFVRVARAARIARTPYTIQAVGVGPIQRPGTARAFRAAFDHAESASVRDEASRERIRAAGARLIPDIEVDPALWPAASPAPSSRRYDLVVNIRQWELGDRAEDRPIKSTADVVVAVADVLNSKHRGARIALVSMSTYESDDDSKPLSELARRLSHEVDCYYDGDLAKIESVVASASGVLSMRLHLALLGIRHGILVAGIAYDEKIAQQGRMHGFPTTPLDGHFGVMAIEELLHEICSPAERPVGRAGSDHANG